MRKYSGLRADIQEMQPSLHCAENGGGVSITGHSGDISAFGTTHTAQQKDADPSVCPTLRRRGETRWGKLEGGELDLYVSVSDYSFLESIVAIFFFPRKYLYTAFS